MATQVGSFCSLHSKKAKFDDILPKSLMIGNPKFVSGDHACNLFPVWSELIYSGMTQKGSEGVENTPGPYFEEK